MNKVTDEGQLKSIGIPDGFIEQQMEPSVWHHSRYVRNFYCKDNPNVRLVFYFRGNVLSEDEGASLVDLLAASPHSLSQEELESLELMLYEDCAPEDFQVAVTRTEVVNGRTVLRFGHGSDPTCTTRASSLVPTQ